jgi:NADPH:quinone reductase-like Zn-dependent oxidoreductase
MPEPVVGEGEVLVRIHAAGVNPFDSKIKEGEFKQPAINGARWACEHDCGAVVTTL